MKILLSVSAALVLAGAVSVRADTTAPTTSHWQVYAWIGQRVESGIMTMTVTGEKVSATFRNNTIHGQIVDYGNQMNATFSGPAGNGWITLHFHNDNNGFGGEWGQKGQAGEGKFVGTRVKASPAPSAT